MDASAWGHPMRIGFAMLLLFCTIIFGADGDIFKGDRFREDGWDKPVKSVWKAIGLSLLLPGAGELYLGDTRSAAVFMTADGAIWSFAIGFAVNATWRADEYKSYAAKYAGVDVNGKDDDFFRTIALYDNRDLYNYSLLLLERKWNILIPETPEWNWDWRSETNQLEYYDIWTSSERAWHNFRIALGVAALNRAISVINILRLARRGALSWNVSLGTYPDADGNIGVSLNLSGNIYSSSH